MGDNNEPEDGPSVSSSLAPLSGTISARYGTGHAFLPPATKLRQGNVFTPVCHSVHWGGGSAIPPSRQPPPAQCMLGCGQQAGGMHPTGM